MRDVFTEGHEITLQVHFNVWQERRIINVIKYPPSYTPPPKKREAKAKLKEKQHNCKVLYAVIRKLYGIYQN